MTHAGLFINTVIGCLFRDMDIMRMALSEGCRGDLHESAVIFQFLDRLRTTISHTGPETAHQLKYGILHISLVSNPSLNTLRNQLLGI